MADLDIQPLLDLLRIPSISTLVEHEPDMAKARTFLVQLFKSLGFTTQILSSSKHPAVFAQLTTDNQQPTVLIYGHYDVQPPDPLDQWHTPPFEPTIKNGLLYARGATDNKGQFMTHVLAVKELLNQSQHPRGGVAPAAHPGGGLPVNFKFLIEGEEEIGSPGIAGIVKKHSQLLKTDYLLVSDSDMPSPGLPAIDISLRGLVYAEVRLATAAHDAHSGLFGGVIPNPANLLAQVISQLKDDHGRVLIPGFYDSVLAPTPAELADFAKLEPAPADIMHESSSFTIGGGESNRTLNERRWSRPTLDVNGLLSGFTGVGSKTIIPGSAMAKISMRLVPHQDPDDIYRKFDSYVRSLVKRHLGGGRMGEHPRGGVAPAAHPGGEQPNGYKLEIIRHSDSLPYQAPTTHPVFSLAKKCLKQAFGSDPVFYASGGSIGAIPLLTKALRDIPCLMIGLGNADDNLHAPNEHIRLSNIEQGITTFTNLYRQLPSLHHPLT